MELDKIEALLGKYEEGNTSLEEENLLREYFTSQDIPAHLKSYKIIFRYSALEKTSTYPLDVKVGGGKRKRGFIGIAASILIAIGLFTAVYNQPVELEQQHLGTIEDPEEAYLQAKATLLMVSQAFNSGAEELGYVEEFSKAKNKYIKE